MNLEISPMGEAAGADMLILAVSAKMTCRSFAKAIEDTDHDTLEESLREHGYNVEEAQKKFRGYVSALYTAADILEGFSDMEVSRWLENLNKAKPQEEQEEQEQAS